MKSAGKTPRSKTPEYRVWSGMNTRCYNKKNRAYPSYGGRGIRVYELWRSGRKNAFDAFLEYVGPRPSPRHSLDRIHNDRDYRPGNVRWATQKEQSRNRRRSCDSNLVPMTVYIPPFVLQWMKAHKNTGAFMRDIVIDGYVAETGYPDPRKYPNWRQSDEL